MLTYILIQPRFQDSACFKMLAAVEHLMLDINLPGPAQPAPSDASSTADTASTSLSHLSSPSFSSRPSVSEPDDILLLEPTKSDTSLDQKATLNWIALSRSDSNIASLSERLSLHSEDDALSISSITNDLNPLAKGDSKETLLKFIMRVNKKRETNSVACQTLPVPSLVASNYQEMHRLVLLRKVINNNFITKLLFLLVMLFWISIVLPLSTGLSCMRMS